jgi:hypothetical protein
MFMFLPFFKPEFDLTLCGITYFLDAIFNWSTLMGGWWSHFRSIPHQLAADIQSLPMFKNDVRLTFYTTRDCFPTMTSRSCSPIQPRHFGTFIRLRFKYNWTQSCTRKHARYKNKTPPMTYFQLKDKLNHEEDKSYINVYNNYFKSMQYNFSTQCKLMIQSVPESVVGSLFEAVDILELIRETILSPDQATMILALHILEKELGMTSVTDLQNDNKVHLPRTRVAACVAQTDEPPKEYRACQPRQYHS